MANSRLASDHGLRLDSADDATRVISSGVSRCIFTLDDLSSDFFDLSNQIAGESFQKLINYNCKVALVVPPDHELGPRITELAWEHRNHPIVRFFPTVEEALEWKG